MFFRRFLNQAAQRIVEITNGINLSEVTKEQVWSSFKYLMSEKTEILINRHLDQIILCAIYGVCKITNPISFKILMEKHSQFYQEEENLFKHVYISPGRTEDIIKFYNTVFIPSMKDYLKSNHFTDKPRIGALCPISPLRANVIIPMSSSGSSLSALKSPLKSPYLTPRTKNLWAESPSQVRGTPLFPQKSSRELDFDPAGPKKKLKVFAQIFEKPEDQAMPMPTLKKD